MACKSIPAKTFFTQGSWGFTITTIASYHIRYSLCFYCNRPSEDRNREKSEPISVKKMMPFVAYKGFARNRFAGLKSGRHHKIHFSSAKN